MNSHSAPLTQKDLAYDRISDTWENFISGYDTNRRLEVLVDDFLGAAAIEGKVCLDAGCGLGYFTEAVRKYHPAQLKACDIAPNLVNKLAAKLPDVECFVANLMELSFVLKEEQFDVVVSSEVIEHCPDPKTATKQMCAAVKPGGLLAISTPNKRWRWLLTLAQIAGLRKEYQGYENWVAPGQLTQWISEEGFEIVKSEGIHTIPFKLWPKQPLRNMDLKCRHKNYTIALNLAVLARKKEA